MKLVFETIVPLRTVSELNNSDHWTQKHKRHSQQKKTIGWHIMTMPPIAIEKSIIKLTRVAPKSMDYDNLVSSFKWIADTICAKINPGHKPGHADKNAHIEYFQEKGAPKTYQIKIQIYCTETTDPL